MGVSVPVYVYACVPASVYVYMYTSVGIRAFSYNMRNDEKQSPRFRKYRILIVTAFKLTPCTMIQTKDEDITDRV